MDALLQRVAVLALLAKYCGPTGLADAGRRRLTTTAKALAPRMHERLVEAIVKALTEQTVTVPGTRTAELVLPQLAAQLQGLLTQRAEAAKQVEEALDTHPLSQLLMSMPGVGPQAISRPTLAWPRSPDSRAYYDRKRAAGKKHNAALVCLARRRVDVLHAMLRNGTYYQPRTPAAA